MVHSSPKGFGRIGRLIGRRFRPVSGHMEKVKTVWGAEPLSDTPYHSTRLSANGQQ